MMKYLTISNFVELENKPGGYAKFTIENDPVTGKKIKLSRPMPIVGDNIALGNPSIGYIQTVIKKIETRDKKNLITVFPKENKDIITDQHCIVGFKLLVFV
jgi:hypothetical protein